MLATPKACWMQSVSGDVATSSPVRRDAFLPALTSRLLWIPDVPWRPCHGALDPNRVVQHTASDSGRLTPSACCDTLAANQVGTHQEDPCARY